MEITRQWEMPNSNTFEIPAIKNLVSRYSKSGFVIVDPFAGKCSIKNIFRNVTYISNDLNREMPTDFHTDAATFLKTIGDNSIDLVLFDPPYSPRQIKECYDGIGEKVFQETTQNTFWSTAKDEVSRVLKIGGVALCFGWNTNGMGISRGFNLVEILIVSHGGNHNDTLCTAEIKQYQQCYMKF